MFLWTDNLCNFSGLWGFSDFLTIFRPFDDFLTDLPIAPPNIINLIILDHNLGRVSRWVRWWARFEHQGEWLGISHEHLNVNTTWLVLTNPKKQISSCRNWHFNQEGRASIRGNKYRFFMVSLRYTVEGYRLCGWTMSEAPAGDLKSHVKITTTTTTTINAINAINLMLANWLSSVSATITNANYTLPGLCWLGTWGLQHRGMWCSYPATLEWTANKIWQIQGRPGCLVLTLSPWPGMTCPRSKPVHDCEVIKASIINAQLERIVWLPIEQDGSTGKRLRWSNEPVDQIGLNVSLQSLQFRRL